MNDLNTLAQQVWSASLVEQKKIILFKMIDDFKYKAKIEQFRWKIEKYNNGNQLDLLASNIALADIKVIK